MIKLKQNLEIKKISDGKYIVTEKHIHNNYIYTYIVKNINDIFINWDKKSDILIVEIFCANNKKIMYKNIVNVNYPIDFLK